MFCPCLGREGRRYELDGGGRVGRLMPEYRCEVWIARHEMAAQTYRTDLGDTAKEEFPNSVGSRAQAISVRKNPVSAPACGLWS